MLGADDEAQGARLHGCFDGVGKLLRGFFLDLRAGHDPLGQPVELRQADDAIGRNNADLGHSRPSWFFLPPRRAEPQVLFVHPMSIAGAIAGNAMT
jgi:hypothetical protein